MYFYDDDGDETEDIVVNANDVIRCVNVEKGRWHSLECLGSGSILLESRDGANDSLASEEIMEEMNSNIII